MILFPTEMRVIAANCRGSVPCKSPSGGSSGGGIVARSLTRESVKGDLLGTPIRESVRNINTTGNTTRKNDLLAKKGVPKENHKGCQHG